MIKNIDAVIFDLDGTLIDSMWVWEQIDIDYLKKRNFRMPNDLQKHIEGKSFKETAIYFKNRFNLKDTIEEIENEWNYMAEYYYENKIPLKDGVKEFLEYLKNKNLKLAIGTSNTRELTIKSLNKHNIINYFDTIVTAYDVEKSKPYPDIFLEAAKILNVSPQKCIVFEDTYSGVLAGKRAGMKVFAVADKLSYKYKNKINEVADKYIKNFKEIA